MKNTKQNKDKFFAQYYGQKIGMFITDQSEKFTVGKNEFIVMLELKPLTEITDEDACEVVKLLYNTNKLSSEVWERKVENENGLWFCNRLNHYDTIIFDLEGFEYLNRDDDEDYKIIINIIDYLRSKGYALPYMGVSVEKQIEWGWIELRNN